MILNSEDEKRGYTEVLEYIETECPWSGERKVERIKVKLYKCEKCKRFIIRTGDLYCKMCGHEINSLDAWLYRERLKLD